MLPLVLLATPPALQQPPPPPPPADGPMMHPPLVAMARELGLSETQTAKLKAIHRAHRDALEDRHEALEKARKALMDAVRDGGDLTSLHAAFSQAHLAALLEARALHAELQAVLTPEQLAKAKALHGKRGPGGHGPGEGGFHPRPGEGLRGGMGPGHGPGGPPPPRGGEE